MSKTGWIPYSRRTPEQQRMSDEIRERAQTFAARSSAVVDVPDEIIYEKAQITVLGEMWPRIWQQSGSCVGAGGWQAILSARVGDVLHRGDNEIPKMHYPWATYGVGRRLGGMRRTGEGSFGEVQARASTPREFGMLPLDHPKVPQPTVSNGWIKWKKSQEIAWSHPSNWPVPEKDLHDEAHEFGAETIARITSLEELDQALAQMRGITIASMLGFNRPRVQDGLLVAEWDTNWAHQMSIGGRLLRSVRWYKIDNQWGPEIHGRCPLLGALGILGSVWIDERLMERVIKSRDAELWAHSDIGDFEQTKIIPWTNINANDWGTFV